MRIKKIVTAFFITLMLSSQSIFAASSDVKGFLQAYFSDGGKAMNIFVSEPLDENASVLIGNHLLKAEVVNSDVKIYTTFLVDNSTSMPYSLREEIKSSIIDYISVMPQNENIKVAMFDTDTVILADRYSDDREFINYELSKIDFEGQASLVYDAVLNVAENTDTSEPAYYRTVLITDGIDSVDKTSFDYLRSVISENGRYHIDVVQVSTESKQDVNLLAMSNLGSNTFTLFNGGVKFNDLVTTDISMLSVRLINEVTTGELKGVTIKNGNTDISLGSLMFPQVEIEDIEEIQETVYIENTELVTEKVSEEAIHETLHEEEISERKKFPLGLTVVIICAIVIGSGVVTFILLKTKKSKKTWQCSISVEVIKEDDRDKHGIGMDVWRFSVDSEFRVGRSLEPRADDNTPLPKNNRAICENATNDDIASIGRNAFVLTYDNKKGSVIIKNIAKRAAFSVETGENKNTLKNEQYVEIISGSKILLGNYTTIIIHNITVGDI